MMRERERKSASHESEKILAMMKSGDDDDDDAIIVIEMGEETQTWEKSVTTESKDVMIVKMMR